MNFLSTAKNKTQEKTNGRKKILKQIDEILANPWKIDIQELHEASMHEPNKIKRDLYDALYNYVLKKRQVDVMNQDDFII